MKILLIQIRQLGDVLLSSPLAKVIKENVPEAEVHFLTSPVGVELLKGNPFIDKILMIRNGLMGEFETIFSVRRESYDAVIDVQRTGRSKRITLLSGAPLKIAFKHEKENYYYNKLIDWKNYGYTVWERMELLKAIGIETPVKTILPKIYYSKDEIKRVKRLIPEGKFVVIVPTARKVEKMWSLKNFALLIDFLKKELRIPTVVCYASKEEHFIEDLKKISKFGFTYPEKPLSIKELAYLIGKATLFIGNNSFASHVAVSQRTKTVVIDKKHSGWFPPLSFVTEFHSNGEFPDFKTVQNAVKKLLL